MSKIDVQFEDDGMDLARKMAEEEEGIGRKPTGWQKWIIPTIAVCWSLYQLALPKFILLDTTYIRAIHLAFALTLVYLNYPLFKKPVFLIGVYHDHCLALVRYRPHDTAKSYLATFAANIL